MTDTEIIEWLATHVMDWRRLPNPSDLPRRLRAEPEAFWIGPAWAGQEVWISGEEAWYPLTDPRATEQVIAALVAKGYDFRLEIYDTGKVVSSFAMADPLSNESHEGWKRATCIAAVWASGGKP